MYLEFHYGDTYFNVPNYPKACVETFIDKIGVRTFNKVLDIGCSVGRSSFELAKYAQKVEAVDFSTRFIRNAINLKEHKSIRYLISTEGELTQMKEAKLEDLGIRDEVDRVQFTQGDACNLKPIYRDYDLIFAGNLIDRLYDPALFLNDIKSRMITGGYLVLTSPYTWLAEFTEKEKWLGGYKENGESLTTFEGLKRILEKDFSLVCSPIDIPFVIRETARKHQHTVAQMTIWKKI